MPFEHASRRDLGSDSGSSPVSPLAAASVAVATVGGLAGAEAGATSAAKVSARITRTSFYASQAGSVRVIYTLANAHTRFSERLLVKRGTGWRTLARARLSWTQGTHTVSVKALFAGRPVRVGSYQARFRADGTQASVAFRVRPSACVFPAHQRGEMYVYLADSATRRQISALRSEIAEAHAQGLVKSFRFVSKAQALAQLKCELSDPSILSLLPDNPLPASFDVIPTRASYEPRIAAALRHMAGIDRTMPGNGIFYS